MKITLVTQFTKVISGKVEYLTEEFYQLILSLLSSCQTGGPRQVQDDPVKQNVKIMQIIHFDDSAGVLASKKPGDTPSVQFACQSKAFAVIANAKTPGITLINHILLP